MSGRLAAPPVEERRSLSVAGLVALALPVIGLALVLARPELDLRWQHQPTHSWLVLATAAAWEPSRCGRWGRCA